MRLVTWNIHNAGAKKVPALTSAIAALQPEVIVLTEYTATVSDLEKSLHAIGLKCWTATKPFDRLLGVAIASRHPLVVGEHETDPCAPWAGLLSVEVEGLHIVGVYSPGKNSHIPGTKPKIKGAWWDGLLARCDRWRHEPTVIIGDFNNGINHVDAPGDDFIHSDKFEALPAHGFSDGWREHHGESESWSFKSKRYGWRRLDHVFRSDGVGVDSVDYVFRVGAIDLVSDPDAPVTGAVSDHAALVAEVHLHNRAAKQPGNDEGHRASRGESK